VQKANRWLKAVPAALMVILVTVPMGMAFDLLHTHTYSFHGHSYEIGESYLVNMPDRVFGMFDYLVTPDFSVFSVHLGAAIKWSLMFFIIGSLESILSAKAIDIIDPWKRKTNLDRDIVAVGAGNLCCAFVGGLPMISEIVRSKANIDNGARTRFADFWHGVFLLLCVALIPTVLHRIPLAALAAMLIYTGFRLTHPKEFLHVYEIGKEQLLIFVATLVGVLTTDLLIGIFIGIGVKLLIHLINGVPVRSLFKSYFDIDLQDDNTAIVRARYSAIFSNWILFRKQLVRLGLSERKNVIVDLSQCKVVDHSVMEKLHDLEREFEAAAVKLEVRGLEGFKQLSQHQLAARKRAMTRLRRVTVVAEEKLEERLIQKFVELGASGYTALPCHGAGRATLANSNGGSTLQIRLEVVVSREVADQILDYLHTDISTNNRITACTEIVEVLRQANF
jgi:MFS superfamily sulfate permease-like transporter